MKKIISFACVFIVLATLFCSCDLLPEELKFSTVNFYVDGQLYDSQTVVTGQSIAMPKTPAKKNEVFVAWVTDGALSHSFDFSSKIIGDTDLHAYFVLDAISMTDMIRQETIKSVVTVINKSYNTGMGGLVEIQNFTSQGSGVVVDISGGYCYVLTNYHVAQKEDGYQKQTISVEDPWGNVYEAKIYKNPKKNDYAMSEKYDLALICFEYVPTSKYSLDEIVMGEDLKVGEYGVSIGTPEGLQNAIAYGQALSYQPIKANEDSTIAKIEFDIVVHDCPIAHGSSGGAFVNTKGQLVGINFAGYDDGTYGCAIPISKVIEFMNLYVY